MIVLQDDFTSDDFVHMSAPVLYQMLGTKVKFLLHAAVRLKREDVVFLYLVENSNKVSHCSRFSAVQPPPQSTSVSIYCPFVL